MGATKRQKLRVSELKIGKEFYYFRRPSTRAQTWKNLDAGKDPKASTWQEHAQTEKPAKKRKAQ